MCFDKNCHAGGLFGYLPVLEMVSKESLSLPALSFQTHEMATDDKSSPTLDSANDLPRSPASPSHLTHFKPLTPDQDEPPFKSAYSSFVNLFRFNKGKITS